MARQRLLGEAVQARLLGFPADEREMIRHATLSSEGFALMLVCLRHPGRVLEGDEVPPVALLNYLARQLDVDPDAFAAYARRDQTRRTHLAELTTRLKPECFRPPGVRRHGDLGCRSPPPCVIRRRWRHRLSKN